MHFSFDFLKNMSQLSVLKMSSAQPNESFFENIDKIVPNLRQLDLSIGIISDKQLECISRLKSLKIIGLFWSHPLQPLIKGSIILLKTSKNYKKLDSKPRIFLFLIKS